MTPSQSVSKLAKECIKCRVNWYLDNYWPDKRMKDGLKSLCKTCMREYSTDWYLANRDKINAKRRARALLLRRPKARGKRGEGK